MSTESIVLVVIVVVLAALLLRNRKKQQAGDGIVRKGWRINYSTGFPATPTPQGAGWFIDFPVGPQAHLHYVQWYAPPKLIVGMTLSVRFKIEGSGFVPIEFPDKPATVTLMVQRRGDDLSAAGKYASYRWFSKATVTMADGEFTLSTPLDVEVWKDVYTGKDPELFRQALADAENIGILFGSAGGRGHGVYVTAPARFTLLSNPTVTGAAS